MFKRVKSSAKTYTQMIASGSSMIAQPRTVASSKDQCFWPKIAGKSGITESQKLKIANICGILIPKTRAM